MRNKSEKEIEAEARGPIVCPGCGLTRPERSPPVDASVPELTAALRYAICCNKDCLGLRGTGCHHCHHPSFWKGNK